MDGIQSTVLSLPHQKSESPNVIANLCANSVKAVIIVHILLEMECRQSESSNRSNLFNIPYNDYDKFVADEDAFRRRMQAFYNDSFVTPGALVVEQFPTSSLTH